MKVYVVIEQWDQSDFYSMEHEGCAVDSKEIVDVFYNQEDAVNSKAAHTRIAREQFSEGCQPKYIVEEYDMK